MQMHTTYMMIPNCYDLALQPRCSAPWHSSLPVSSAWPKSGPFEAPPQWNQDPTAAVEEHREHPQRSAQPKQFNTVEWAPKTSWNHPYHPPPTIKGLILQGTQGLPRPPVECDHPDVPEAPRWLALLWGHPHGPPEKELEPPLKVWRNIMKHTLW